MVQFSGSTIGSSTTLNGGTLAVVTGTATYTIQSGTLSGSVNSTIDANLTVNGGDIYPGGNGTIGTLTVTKNYTQNGGTLHIDVNPGAGTSDQLVVNSPSPVGIVTLGGRLHVHTLGNPPANDATFDIIKYSFRVGDYTNQNKIVTYPTGAYLTIPDGPMGTYQLKAQSKKKVAAPDAGRAPLVKAYDAQTNQERFSFLAYDVGFLGGVRVAMGDVNGDSIDDIITGPGSGMQAEVKAFNGVDGSFLYSFVAYASFTGGIYVAAGDVNGDGIADIITGKDAGSDPEVKIFNGLSGSLLSSFLAFDPSFTGGVRVAAGDVNGDGKADIIAGAGAGGTPQVKVFNGVDNALLLSFLAYEPTFTGGVYVAAGDSDGDGKADIITGPGAGRAPEVRTFSGLDGTPWSIVLVYAPSFTGGVRVAARDVNGDGRADIITGMGPGGTPEVALFDGLTLAELDRYLAYEPTFTGGIFVG